MDSLADIQLPNTGQLAIPLYIIGILIEFGLVCLGKAKGQYERRDAMTSLLMGVGNVATGIIYAVVLIAMMQWAYSYRIFDPGITWWSAVLCFVLDDFRRYVYHAGLHRIRWWWADHVNHHSSQHFNFTTALRQPWTTIFTGSFLLYLPLAWLGFHPLLILFVGGINLTYQFFVHTETVGKLWKPIEFVLNTPSHHRVHHSNNPRYLDANYAAVLIIWDRIFGTFVEEREEDVPKYGLVQNIGTFNLFFVAFHEWISIFKDMAKPGLTLRERLMYMFAAPGWSHDGSRKTSWDLKAQYVRKHPDQSGMPGLPDLVAKNDGSAGRVQPAE
jgi:sterol desaturase/sphingolipid hydroxylase (fatty acid hydroxylase superfamily)